MRTDGRRVFDTVMFFKELDLLELRLTELDSVVDVFVIAECDQTHSGKPKPLYFAENKERFEKWLHKIKHLVVDLKPIAGSWQKETFNRSVLSQGASGYYDVKVECLQEQPLSRPQDIIGVFDLDEIPSRDTYDRFDPEMGVCKVGMWMSYYYANCRQQGVGHSHWNAGTIFTHERAARDGICLNGDIMRKIATSSPMLENGGWHFSYAGGHEFVKEKLAAFAHTEHADMADRDDHILACLDTGADLYGRVQYERVDLDATFPKALLDNQALFASLIKRDGPDFTRRYGFKVSQDQFGNAVPEHFFDVSETICIEEVEKIVMEVASNDKKLFTTIELGADQAYYSLLMKSALRLLRPDCEVTSVLVEPNDEYFPRGRHEFALNGLEGTWLNKSIGSIWEAKGQDFGKEEVTVDELVEMYAPNGLDILHCDIDGAEKTMLEGALASLERGAIDHIVLLTHGAQRHGECRDILCNFPYEITLDHPENNIGFDGLIVARSTNIQNEEQ